MSHNNDVMPETSIRIGMFPLAEAVLTLCSPLENMAVAVTLIVHVKV